MKYLIVLAFVATVLGQGVTMLTRDGGSITQVLRNGEYDTSYTCFAHNTTVDCLGKMRNTYLLCNTKRYGNGKKESADGECCYNNKDCNDVCNEFVCMPKNGW